jgi:hypothetical protein
MLTTVQHQQLLLHKNGNGPFPFYFDFFLSSITNYNLTDLG